MDLIQIPTSTRLNFPPVHLKGWREHRLFPPTILPDLVLCMWDSCVSRTTVLMDCQIGRFIAYTESTYGNEKTGALWPGRLILPMPANPEPAPQSTTRHDTTRHDTPLRGEKLEISHACNVSSYAIPACSARPLALAGTRTKERRKHVQISNPPAGTGPHILLSCN